jgi:Uma2 family endonuclease
MSTIQFETEAVHLPLWVTDLESFRRWMDSEESPEKATVCYLAGEVWVEMSKKQKRLGRYFSDGLFLTNIDADLSTKPDGTFASRATFDSGRVQLIEGAQEGFVELEGTPDMVLEVASSSSVSKDTEWLRDLSWQAGIAEYWPVDCRGERLEFEILRHTSRGYSASRKTGGWIKPSSASPSA